MRRAAGLLLLAVSSALLLPGPAGGVEDPLPAVQRVLDTRADAVRSGDRGAFLATVDPRAPEEFRQAQARHFDGLRSLPLDSFSLRASTKDTGDLGRGAAGRYGGARVFLPETRQRYRIRGYDDRDRVETLWLTFVNRAGRWLVGGDTDLEALGLETDRQLWDLGPVRVQPTEHFAILSNPQQAARAAAVAGIAEQGMASLDRAWPLPWSRRIPIVVPTTKEELERLLESTLDLDKFVAFVTYDTLRDEGYEVTAPRLFLHDRKLAQISSAGQVATLVHELSHAAAAPVAGPFVPIWVHEGVAEWLAKGRPTGERRPPGSDGVLPRDDEFTAGSADAIARSYGESRSAVSFLAATKGPGAPAALLRALGEPRVEAGSTDYRVDAALRQVAGLSLADFQSAWGRR